MWHRHRVVVPRPTGDSLHAMSNEVCRLPAIRYRARSAPHHGGFRRCLWQGAELKGPLLSPAGLPRSLRGGAVRGSFGAVDLAPVLDGALLDKPGITPADLVMQAPRIPMNAALYPIEGVLSKSRIGPGGAASRPNVPSSRPEPAQCSIEPTRFNRELHSCAAATPCAASTSANPRHQPPAIQPLWPLLAPVTVARIRSTIWLASSSVISMNSFRRSPRSAEISAGLHSQMRFRAECFVGPAAILGVGAPEYARRPVTAAQVIHNGVVGDLIWHLRLSPGSRECCRHRAEPAPRQ